MIVVPSTRLVLLVFDHILCHLEGAQILVHALQLCVVCGVLVPVQKAVDGLVVVVNDAAVLLLVVTWEMYTSGKNGHFPSSRSSEIYSHLLPRP